MSAIEETIEILRGKELVNRKAAQALIEEADRLAQAVALLFPLSGGREAIPPAPPPQAEHKAKKDPPLAMPVKSPGQFLTRAETFEEARKIMAAEPDRWFSINEIHARISENHLAQSLINFQAFFAPVQTKALPWLARKKEGVNVFFSVIRSQENPPGSHHQNSGRSQSRQPTQ